MQHFPNNHDKVLNKYIQTPEDIYISELNNYENNLFNPIKKREIVICLQNTFSHINNYRDEEDLIDCLQLINIEINNEELWNYAKELINIIIQGLTTKITNKQTNKQTAESIIKSTQAKAEDIIDRYSNTDKKMQLYFQLSDWKEYFEIMKTQYSVE